MADALEKKVSDFERDALTHIEPLYNFAMYLTRKQAEAEDLVQETYLRVFRFSHKFQPGTHLRAWLFQIARNTFFTFYRTRDREAAVAEDGVPDWDTPMFQDAPSYDAQATDAHTDLERAMRTLPEEYRTVLLLAEVESLPLEEVARIMSSPVGTVKSRLFRAKARLRKNLHEYRAYSQNGHRALKDADKSPAQPDGLKPIRQKKYGDDPFAFFQENFDIYRELSPTRFIIAYRGLYNKIQEAGKWREAKSLLQHG